MTSIADQSVQELGGPGSILARQKQDHISLDILLEEFLRSSGVDQQAVLNRVWRLAFPHAFAEEAVLWPVPRLVVPGGGQLTLEVEEEQQEINGLGSRHWNLTTTSVQRSWSDWSSY